MFSDKKFWCPYLSHSFSQLNPQFKNALAALSHEYLEYDYILISSQLC